MSLIPSSTYHFCAMIASNESNRLEMYIEEKSRKDDAL